nr:electron transport complex protein RnfC [Raoultella sp. NCTC 9187]
MLRAVLSDAHGISLRVIPTKYPSGGAKQLTQILTGKQVPHGGRSSDIGILMQNVGTAYAVKTRGDRWRTADRTRSDLNRGSGFAPGQRLGPAGHAGAPSFG